MQHAFQIFNFALYWGKASGNSIFLPRLLGTEFLVNTYVSLAGLVPNREFWSVGQDSGHRLAV